MITAPHLAHRHHNTMNLPPSTPSPLAGRVVNYHWVAERGGSVELVLEPAPSPGLNMDDLGFFASL